MSLKQIYLNYDEDSLALYANIGLVRRARKDIDANKVQLIEQSDTTLRFDADGQQVTLAEQGIQTASCNCPVNGHCKHIVAAILWLQTHAELCGAVASKTNLSDKQDPTDVVLENAELVNNALNELLALDADKLLKSAGKANVRLAYQLVFEWQGREPLVIQNQGVQLRITIPESEAPIIYMAGTGFSGMISSLLDKQKIAVHLAIIAYLFEQHQQKWEWPASILPQDTELDQLSEDESALIEQIERHIYTLLNHGLSHVSHSQATQLQLLNMSARSQGLPRLAAMLRHLCQLVELLAHRHFTVEEQDLLLFLARLKAYIEMLSNHQGEALSKLRSGERRQYQAENEIIELMPLGAQWWQSKTGAVGATFYFWDLAQSQYRESTLARSNKSDPNFNRHSIWHSASIWQAMPDTFMKKSIRLHHPRLSDDAKLASYGSTVMLQDRSWNHDNYAQFRASTGFQNWSILRDFLQNSNLGDSLLSDICFIHINKYHSPYLDEIRQSLVWPVEDNDGNKLFLQIFWDEYASQRIDILQSFLETANKALTVLVKPIQQESYLDLEPFALLYKEAKTGNILSLSLDFDTSWCRGKKAVGGFLNRIKSYLTQKKQLVENRYTQDPLSTALIQPILDILASCSCSGRAILSTTQKQHLTQLQQDCDSLGLISLSNVLKKLLDTTQLKETHILQAVYLCHLLKNTQYQLPIELNLN